MIDNLDGSYRVSYSTTLANVYEHINLKLTQSGGLLANYYTDYGFTNKFANGIDLVVSVIDFNWGTSVPLPSFPASDYWSVTFEGHLYPPYTQTYTIYVPIDAGTGFRLTINNIIVLDEWTPLSGESDPFVRIQMTQNTLYPILLEMREQTGNATISLQWESALM